MFHLRFHSEASKVSEWEEGRAGVSGSSGRIARDGRDVSRWAGCISGCEGYLRVGRFHRSGADGSPNPTIVQPLTAFTLRLCRCTCAES